MTEILYHALIEMFSRVGIETDRHGVDMTIRKDPRWRMRKRWSQRDREDFREWLIKYLRSERDEAPTLTAEDILRKYGWDVE